MVAESSPKRSPMMRVTLSSIAETPAAAV